MKKSLEELILDCWNVTDDLDVLFEAIMEDGDEITKDYIGNVVLGLSQLYKLKFQRLFREFETHIHENSPSNFPLFYPPEDDDEPR